MSSSANAIYRKLRPLVADTLGVEEDEVVPDAAFADDLNADQQDLIELFLAVEEVFDVSIPVDEIGTLATVGDVVEYLEDKLA